jgi:hypothetical protein
MGRRASHAAQSPNRGILFAYPVDGNYSDRPSHRLLAAGGRIEMSLLPLFRWYNHTPLSAAMQSSTWAFAAIEMVHLLGLALLGGVVLIVDLRLLGLILAGRPAERIARDLMPLLKASLVVLIVSGVLMVGEETMKCYYNPAFRLKMLFFAAALVFYFAVHRRVADSHIGPGWVPKLAAGVSLTLWLSVGVAGRAIGFL